MHSINWLISDLWISQFCELIFHGNNERVACQHTDRPIDQVELKLCYSKKRHWCKNQISWFSYAYICYTCVSRFTLQKKTRLVVSSHLNNMFVKLDHLKIKNLWNRHHLENKESINFSTNSSQDRILGRMSQEKLLGFFEEIRSK